MEKITVQKDFRIGNRIIEKGDTLRIIEASSIQVGKEYKIDFNNLKKASNYHPNWMSLLRKMQKQGGGTVYVTAIKGNNAVIKAHKNDFMGTAEVPVSSLK